MSEKPQTQDFGFGEMMNTMLSAMLSHSAKQFEEQNKIHHEKILQEIQNQKVTKSPNIQVTDEDAMLIGRACLAIIQSPDSNPQLVKDLSVEIPNKILDLAKTRSYLTINKIKAIGDKIVGEANQSQPRKKLPPINAEETPSIVTPAKTEPKLAELQSDETHTNLTAKSNEEIEAVKEVGEQPNEPETESTAEINEPKNDTHEVDDEEYYKNAKFPGDE